MIIGRRSRKCMPPPSICDNIYNAGGSLKDKEDGENNVIIIASSSIQHEIKDTKKEIDEEINVDPTNDN